MSEKERKPSRRGFLAGAAGVIAGMTTKVVLASSSRPIRIGYISLSFHEASALEVQKLVESHGHKTTIRAAPHEAMFKLLGDNEVDILVSAWLPGSHRRYLDPIEPEVRRLGVLYQPYCIWGVPDYVPESEVASVADLLKSPALDRMERLIQGINPGAGISRFSMEIIESYKLDQAGYEFKSGTEEDCFGRFIKAEAEGKWVVVPLWHPQFLHNRYKIRALEEPRGLLRGVDNATLIVRRDAEALLGEQTLIALNDMALGNARVSALDDEINQSRFPK